MPVDLKLTQADPPVGTFHRFFAFLFRGFLLFREERPRVPTGMTTGSREKASAKPAEDYYAILGVSKTATDEEIKRAYRKLALQFHPDKNSDPDATARFQEINKAYRVLGDPKRRSTYDFLGTQAGEMMNHYDDPESRKKMSTCSKILVGSVFFGTCCCCCCFCCCFFCCAFCFNFCCCGCCGTKKRSTVSSSDDSNENEGTSRSRAGGPVHQQPTDTMNNSEKY